MNERLINVYDHQNPDRLLGHFSERDIPESPEFARILEFAVMPRMEAFPYGLYGEVPYTLTFEKATFFKGWEQTDWLTKRLCLTTHTELELLVQLPNFRLPGEDAVDAKRRRFTRGF